MFHKNSCAFNNTQVTLNQGPFCTFIGCDYRTQSIALSFLKNVFIRNGKKWHLFKGWKQTCSFFRKLALRIRTHAPNVWNRPCKYSFFKEFLSLKCPNLRSRRFKKTKTSNPLSYMTDVSKVIATVLHFMTTFHNFILKIETSWAARLVWPLLWIIKCQWCMYAYYFSWNRVLIWSLKNQCSLNFNCDLSIIKLAEDLEILLCPWGVPLPIQLTLCGERFVTASRKEINHLVILKHLCVNTFLLFQLYVD